MSKLVNKKHRVWIFFKFRKLNSQVSMYLHEFQYFVIWYGGMKKFVWRETNFHNRSKMCVNFGTLPRDVHFDTSQYLCGTWHNLSMHMHHWYTWPLVIFPPACIQQKKLPPVLLQFIIIINTFKICLGLSSHSLYSGSLVIDKTSYLTKHHTF